MIRNIERYYYDGDDSVLPRSIATRAAFLNAMTLDIAMGGSTNTVLHLLAIAREAGVDFTMKDIDTLSRKVPCICKVAPNSSYHVEDVNRAGGILSIMGELNRAFLLDVTVKRVDTPTLGDALRQFDVMSTSVSVEALDLYNSAPGGRFNLKLGSQDAVFDGLDTDRKGGCIRSTSSAYTADGGLAVLFGNIARCGCIVKTAGADASLMTFTGKAIVFESQEEAVEGILTSGLSIGHTSPEAASGGEIALIEDGDEIRIDIPSRSIELMIGNEEFERRRKKQEARGKEAYTPLKRNREVSKSLKIYAAHVLSADTGAVREDL